MTSVSEALFDTSIPVHVRRALFDAVLSENGVFEWTPILTPTDTNDDVNGSQHAVNGGTDFSYRDASLSDLSNAESFGFYEYFSREGSGYTGHYYNGDGNHFAAIVVNPPAYAATYTV